MRNNIERKRTADQKRRGVRRCIHCCQEKPIEQFRKIRADRPGRRGECNGCHREAERKRTQNGPRKENGMAIQKAAAEICQVNSVKRIMGIVEAMVQRFGGPEGLAAEWKQVYDQAERDKRYRRASHQLIGTMKLLETSAELKLQRARFLEQEELTDEYTAAPALRNLGWTVAPPENP